MDNELIATFVRTLSEALLCQQKKHSKAKDKCVRLTKANEDLQLKLMFEEEKLRAAHAKLTETRAELDQAYETIARQEREANCKSKEDFQAKVDEQQSEIGELSEKLKQCRAEHAQDNEELREVNMKLFLLEHKAKYEISSLKTEKAALQEKLAALTSDYEEKAKLGQSMDTVIQSQARQLCDQAEKTSALEQVREEKDKLAQLLQASEAEKRYNVRRVKELECDLTSMSNIHKKLAELNWKTGNGSTVLYWACYYGYEYVVKFLLENEVTLDEPNKHGATPLHAASSMGYTEIVAVLLENGARMNAQDKHGESPLYYAKKLNREGVVKLLTKAGAK